MKHNYFLFIAGFLIITILYSSSAISMIITKESASIQNREKEIISGTLNTPDIVIYDTCCWLNPLKNQVRFIGSLMNNGTVYNMRNKHFHVAFFAENNQNPFDIITIPTFFDLGLWYNKEIETFYVDYPSTMVNFLRVSIDYYNDLIESNEDNNIAVVPVGPSLMVTGVVSGKNNQLLQNISIVSYVLDYDTQAIGPQTYTDEQGFYQLSIPAKKPFDEPHSYTIIADGFEGYQDQKRTIDDVVAGSYLSVDFTLEKKVRSIQHIFFLLSMRHFKINAGQINQFY